MSMKKTRRIISNLINGVLSFFKLEIKVSNTGFWDRDPAFLNIYNEIRDRSLVKIDRCYILYQYAKHASLIPDGDVAQVGVYRGGTARLIAECFEKTKKSFFLFDTFEGLPALTQKDARHGVKISSETKQFSDTSLNEVSKYLSGFSGLEMKKGYFPDTAKGLEDRRFCFVYLDADLYQSTKDGLEFFYPKMVLGGVILLDDYQTNNWPGVDKAVKEFQEKHKISPITTTWWQGLIIRTTAVD